jgi:hypothetical protein
MSLEGKKSKKTKRIMIIQKRVLVLGSAVLCMAMTSFANLITNGSFESGNFVPDANDTMSLPLGATDMTGWTVIAADLAWIGPSNPFSLSASDGSNFLDLSGYHDNAPYAGVEQTIPTVIGGQYEISLDLGLSTLYDTMPVGAVVNAGSDSTTFTSGTPSSINEWQTFTYDFTATSANTTIQIIGQVADDQSQKYIGLDNVSVQLIPEPGTLALFAGSGLIALVGWRRSRKV